MELVWVPLDFIAQLIDLEYKRERKGAIRSCIVKSVRESSEPVLEVPLMNA